MSSEFRNFHIVRSYFFISTVRQVAPFMSGNLMAFSTGEHSSLVVLFLFSFSGAPAVCWTASSDYLLYFFPSLSLLFLGKAKET